MEKFFEILTGKKVAFIGAGVAHRDLLVLFARAGAKVTLCDRKPLADFGPFGDELMSLGVRLSLGENYLDGLAGQEMILRTPGFEFYTPALQQAKQAGALVTSEMELFFEYCPCPIVGITGSDGKTTTTSLIAAILQAAGRKVHLGGNIGAAMLPLVDDIAPGDIAVVELSSFQLISMERSPHIAVVTNITPNHLDHHRDMEEYIGAKKNILKYQKPGDIAVLGYEYETTRALAPEVKGELRWFSRLRRVDDGAFLNDEGILCLAHDGHTQGVLPASDVRLRGLHNIENMLAAFAALQSEAGTGPMAEVGDTFTGVEHRIEPVRVLDGVQWFNDSIATSPTRVIAGLRAFEDEPLILIAGGYDKNIPFEPMAAEAVNPAGGAKVKAFVLTGPAADKIENALRTQPGFARSGMNIRRAKDLAEAVSMARAMAKPGDIVTLSPGCASFDAYPNFAARGRHFKDLVNALESTGAVAL